MHTLLGKLSKKILESENDNIKYRKYLQMMEHDGWKTHLEWLHYLRGLMAEELLSDRFARMDAIEKDVHQRAYNLADHLIRFLINPSEGPRHLMEWIKHIKRMEATNRKRPQGVRND